MTAPVPSTRDATADSSSASWKFDFLDTVNADPLCKPACLKMIKAYLTFASEASPTAFMAKSEMALRTGLGEATIKRTHRLLVKLGYLKRVEKTKGGAIQYRLVNARKALISDHLVFGREKLADEKRERKRRNRVGSRIKMSPPKSVERDQNEPSERIKMSPKSLENTLEVLAMKEGANTIGTAADRREGLDRLPLPIPSCEEEAEAILQQIVYNHDVPAFVINALRLMLGRGTLTVEKAHGLLRQYEQVAA